MLNATKFELMLQLFEAWAGEKAIEIKELPVSGSNRQYFRIIGTDKTVIGAYNNKREENEAYISFTSHFLKYNIPVPKIELVSDDHLYYLVEDLGDDSLYNHVISCKGKLNTEVVELYKKSLSYLISMQVDASKTLDYSVCYPVSKFDADAIQWDLNYFKYSFLMLSGVAYNEFLLEKDFKALKEFLLTVPMDYFMFRDFQSRNILIKNSEPYFIDFQGGRKGPLTYDVASLLYQAKAQIPDETRMKLFNYYYEELNKKQQTDYHDLLHSYKCFSLLRLLQVLGAYGFRGYFEKKPHFIESIPFAIRNLKELLLNTNWPIELPHLKLIAEKLKAPVLEKLVENEALTVSITSFSYRKGIPSDPSDNGGGFVFDCRSIHNPGRYDEYKQLTGKDQAVIDFFEREDEMEEFLEPIFRLVDKSIEVYQSRKFDHLMVNFGCTGGQHRSVYSAERLAAHLKEKYSLNIKLWHREQE